jgi:uncharacterized protein (DUF58 family)
VISLRQVQHKLAVYSPLRINFFVAMSMLLSLDIALNGLYGVTSAQPTAQHQILALMLGIAAISIGSLLAMALLSLIVSYILLRYKSHSLGLKITETSKVTSSAILHMSFTSILRPILGGIEGSARYNGTHLTPVFQISSQASQGWWRHNFTTKVAIELPVSKTYHIDQLIILFRDIFGFFSLPRYLSVQTTITHIKPNSTEPLEIKPSRSFDATLRIQELQKVDGEYLRFKKYEAGDDRRRIIWRKTVTGTRT